MATSLGNILVDQGILTSDELERAENHRAENGGSLAKALVELDLATESDLVHALATKLGMPYVSLEPGTVEPDAAQMVSRSVAESLGALPIGFGDGGNELVVAVSDPNNTTAKEKIEAETGLPVRLGLAPRRALQQAIQHLTTDAPSGGGPEDSARIQQL
ncbi:MAG: hypothetical protein R3343_10950, partial [Nitriliruptorales bacterium]|nr:hypothetical protein [Nitriliruptorales bacterium]